MSEPYFFDPVELDALAERERSTFERGQPFPHLVIDGLFPDALLDAVVDEAPGRDERSNWVEWSDENSVKRGLREDWTMGPTTRLLLTQFNSAAFVNFLEGLTGIAGLIPDPHFFGGGLHAIERGGYLRIHADFNHYPRLDLQRRVNALLYLNRDWEEEWGGHLELWDRTLSRREAMIAPLFNRLVVFATTDTAYHGHPNPLETPPGIARRSLALYYYSTTRPADELTEAHSTLWQPGVGEIDPRPAEGGGGAAARPGGTDEVPSGPDPTAGTAAHGGHDGHGIPAPTAPTWKRTAREWVPPIAWRAAHRWWRALRR